MPKARIAIARGPRNQAAAPRQAHRPLFNRLLGCRADEPGRLRPAEGSVRIARHAGTHHRRRAVARAARRTRPPAGPMACWSPTRTSTASRSRRGARTSSRWSRRSSGGARRARCPSAGEPFSAQFSVGLVGRSCSGAEISPTVIPPSACGSPSTRTIRLQWKYPDSDVADDRARSCCRWPTARPRSWPRPAATRCGRSSNDKPPLQFLVPLVADARAARRREPSQARAPTARRARRARPATTCRSRSTPRSARR